MLSPELPYIYAASFWLLEIEFWKFWPYNGAANPTYDIDWIPPFKGIGPTCKELLVLFVALFLLPCLDLEPDPPTPGALAFSDGILAAIGPWVLDD